MKTYESIWTGAKGTGAPMQEATLCSDHRMEWRDEAESLARDADDFSGYHWADSTESVEVHRTVTQVHTFEIPADVDDTENEVSPQVEAFEWSDRHTVEIDWDAYIIPTFEEETK